MLRRRQDTSLVADTMRVNTFCAAVLLLLRVLAIPSHDIVVDASGFVANSRVGSKATSVIAAVGCRSRTNPSFAVHAPDRETRRRYNHRSGTQPNSAYCFRSTPWIPHLRSGSDEYSPATTLAERTRPPRAIAKAATRVCSGRAPSDGILSPVKEKIKMRGERDDALDTILLYFAFGANMCPSILVNNRGVRPYESLPAEAKSFVTDTRQKRDGTRDSGENGNSSSIHDEEDGERGVCLCFCHRAGKTWRSIIT